MTQSRLFALLLAAPLWHGLLLGQQTQDPPTTALLSPAPIADALGRFAALQCDDGQLIGAGADYRARFDCKGAQFTPALGELAPVEFPVTVRGVAFGRGAPTQPLPAVDPTCRERTVCFHHGFVDETYEVRPDGVKQSFVFYERPAGIGDLVVAVGVATQLALQAPTADAVTFGNEFGGVRIAGVVGIDALGRRCKGSVSFVDNQVQLRLPAAFVDQVALPLVLDPLVGAVIAVNSTGRNLDPAAAYDAGTGKYLVVWWRRLSASTGDIYGQFVNRVTTAGADLSGSSVVIRSGANSQRARVANCSVRNAFVVGWQEIVNMVPLPTHRDLLVRAMSPTTLGATLPLAISLNDENGLELAGNATESSGTVLSTWLRNGNVMLQSINVSAALACSPGTLVTVSSTGTNTAVRLPRSGGANDRYLLAWLNAAGSIFVSTFVGTTQVDTSVILGNGYTSDFALDGDGTNWCMAASYFEVGSTTLRDIGVLVFGWNTVTAERDLVAVEAVATTPGLQEFRPAVAMVGRNVVVAWTQGTSPQVLGMRTYGMSFCSFCEPPLTVFTGTAGQQVVACLATQASGRETAASRDEALIVWQPDNGTASTLQAQRWKPADGIATEIMPGCGGLTATATDECSSYAGVTHVALLQNAPTGSAAWLVFGFARRDATGCGACVLVPDLFSGFLFGPQSADAYGNIVQSIPIAGGSALIGLTYYQQWLVQDAVTPGCPIFAFDLSNALQVVIQ